MSSKREGPSYVEPAPLSQLKSPIGGDFAFLIRMSPPSALSLRIGFASSLASFHWSKVLMTAYKKPSRSSYTLQYSVGTKDSSCSRCLRVESFFHSMSDHDGWTSVAP